MPRATASGASDGADGADPEPARAAGSAAPTTDSTRASTRRVSAKARAAAVAADEAAGTPLARYGAMRNFEATPEPDATPPAHAPRNDEPLTFVVQKHRATRLHYDVRFEVDGAMPSWPVPKGPSANPVDKRLAVQTEDHPLGYAVFEGVIPKGQYGAGEVIVWDRGTYSPDESEPHTKGPLVFEDRAEANRRMRAGIAAGKVSVTMRGERMKGSWALVKTKQAADSWLLIKHRDDAADPARDLTALDTSVICGLTIAELQAGRLPPAEVVAPPLLAGDLPGATRASMPASLDPMQATLSNTPFAHPNWTFEPKLDGVRAVARLEGGTVRLTSRRGLDSTHQYPSVAASVARQPANSLVLDGEIVALNEAGVPSFERLQQRMGLSNPVDVERAERDVPVVYYVFDVLYLDGVDVRRVPLEQRRALLRRTVVPTATLRLLEPLEVDGVTAADAAQALGLEGLIAKRRDSVYESGRRSSQWLKVKHRLADEFVVVGYSSGLNSRASTFGALAIATRTPDGELVSVGRVGSGFDDSTLRALHRRLEGMRVDRPPLRVTRDQARDVTWVRPELVVEVKFAERTADGNLRAPVFMRVRDDKPAADVRAVPSAPAPASTPVGSSSPPDAPPALAHEIASVLAQLEAARKQATLEVEGARIAVTNLDKVMWPPHTGPDGEEQRALTKRDLIAYYARMAPYLLPQLRDRPLTMTRYPNGLEGSFFYQKHVEALPGDFVQTIAVFTSETGQDEDFIVVNNLATLVWLAQTADLALHISLARANPTPDGGHLATTYSGSREQVERSLLNYPDFALFDLDPYIYRGDEARGAEPEYNRHAYEQTTEVARWLKELLDSAGLASFVKTSGATGLHVFVPVLRQYDYETIREVAQTLGGFLVRAHPREVTMEWDTKRRTGKVFFDANQNARNKNLACAYSPRAKPGAPVSMPLRWEELGDVMPGDFTVLNAQARVEAVGDLWAHILEAKHDLASLLGPAPAAR